MLRLRPRVESTGLGPEEGDRPIIASRLAHALETYAERQAGGGGTVIPDADLIVDERNTYVSPDIMYFAGDRFSASDPDERIRILPDLVVEILSPGTEDYDRTGKQALYARLGIPQYWIADAAQRTMAELTLDAGGQYRERTTRAPDPFRPALFSDLAISLSALFA